MKAGEGWLELRLKSHRPAKLLISGELTNRLACRRILYILCRSLSISGSLDRHIYGRAIEGAEVGYVGEN